MEEKDKDVKLKSLMPDDELNGVAGGTEDLIDFKFVHKRGSTDSSGDIPKYAAGQTVKYLGEGQVPKAIIISIAKDKAGILFKEFVYTIRITEGDYLDQQGECYEHQICL